jgi:hypothetical protein
MTICVEAAADSLDFDGLVCDRLAAGPEACAWHWRFNPSRRGDG